MTPAKLMTNRFLVRCGELWPDTIRLEETGVGDGTPTSYVNQAIALLGAGNIKAAIPLLRRRTKHGVKGKTDLTGFLVREINGEKIPMTIGIEIKATKGERISDDQQEYHSYLRSFGVPVIVVRDIEQGIRDLAVYAGPGREARR